MNTGRLIYFALFFISGFQIEAQICLNDVELDRISQLKVREYLKTEQERGVQTFEEIKPSMQPSSDIKGYLVRENVYLVKKGIDEVWSNYINRGPNKSWNGKKVSFGFLFSKKEDKLVYSDENITAIDTGMVVYLNLRLMSGLINMATAFEIIKIDRVNKIIEFSYLTGNVSVGKQRIQFLETSKGNTEIWHTTFYKSNNIVKNYFFYPYFHTRVTNEFHRNIKRIIQHT
jgi:flagellar basal body rod protein FlgC